MTKEWILKERSIISMIIVYRTREKMKINLDVKKKEIERKTNLDVINLETRNNLDVNV